MDSVHPISTAQVPAQFLQTAMLTGVAPLKALRSDPRVSYCLYVPSEHYNPDPNRRSISEGEASHPSYKLPKIPLVISVHGTGRDATTCCQRLVQFADTERCAILAPLFPAGLDDELDLDSYKLLRSKTLKSDLALLDILAEVKQRYPGIYTERFFLAGFSGGGQFVHRFLYVHPEAIIAASVGAPGRVTHLDKALKWPQGIANVSEIFQKELRATGGDVSLDSLRKIREIQMVVGGDDIEIPSDEFSGWVKMMKAKKYRDGGGEVSSNLEPMRTTRVDTLRNLYQEWSSLGLSTTFQVVKEVKHDSGGIHPTVEAFLTLRLKDWWSSREGPSE